MPTPNANADTLDALALAERTLNAAARTNTEAVRIANSVDGTAGYTAAVALALSAISAQLDAALRLGLTVLRADLA